ncbi:MULTISPECIES: hypothetical protein [Halomonadaceae]|uniref:hypothetical protein n=1 Tax=Halomonadaceae TaxID=28256 RepID=UPI001583B627|nr:MULTISPECIES: hypothetical protein [Halomonas]MDI4636931.1 hypothetical protein [Halomonas sp. BMC7]NUJ58098.1 hypothetical protein [Halomonas taeanensis]
MIYLEREASELYFELSLFYFHAEKLSWTHYLDRMLALKNMCEPSDPVYEKARRILLVEEWDIEDVWPLENDERDGDSSVSGLKKSGEEEIQPGLRRGKNGCFQFLSRKKGLNDWVFHQYDRDFHPSIPHGHFKGKSQPKLDSYLGWVYQGSKQVKRLSRGLIVDLWNDEEFRAFAKVAIEWYVFEFPSYNWRVRNPLMLPRRR